jgi:hypothetical protein
MRIPRIYTYLYYRLYAWNLRTWGQSDGPQYNALYGVSFMMLINLALVGILLLLVGVGHFSGEVPMVETLTAAFAILGLNYFRLVRGRRYETIAKSYDGEPNETRFRNAVLLWVYAVASMVLPLVLFMLYKKLTHCGHG